MARTRKSTASARVSKKAKGKRWAEMQPDLLLKIFSSFNLMDLILSFSRVCHSWWQVCSEPVLWGTLDLTVLGNYFDVPSIPGAWIDRENSQRLNLILKNATNLGRENIHTLIFHFYIYLKDVHLLLPAQRCHNVKRLVLPAWNLISLEGFEVAIRNWRGLESMLVPYLNSPYDILRLIGENCDNFSELKVMNPFDLLFALSITKFLPRLKKLSLRCAIVHKEAIEHLLDNLKHLEVLNLSHSLVVYVPVEGKPVYIFRNICSSIVKRASRLREFHTCQRNVCGLCRRSFVDENQEIKWHELEEGLWREDEVSCFAH